MIALQKFEVFKHWQHYVNHIGNAGEGILHYQTLYLIRVEGISDQVNGNSSPKTATKNIHLKFLLFSIIESILQNCLWILF